MKAKELARKLLNQPDAEVFFEEAGHDQGGEAKTFPLSFRSIYGFDNEVTIVLEEN